MRKDKISGWGNYPEEISEIERFYTQRDLLEKISATTFKGIPRGNARSYGDSANAPTTLSSLHHNRILIFNVSEGMMTCESGVLFSDILDVIVPKGWFLPVTPGTKYITVGGAVASDVHGKNHHVDGSFSNHIEELTILCGDGVVRTCSRSLEASLFQATCGGMGLTGVILNVTFKLKKIESSYISQKQIKARNLDEILDLFDEYQGTTYTMAWIDCLKGGKGFGRSILMCGEHTTIDKLDQNKASTPLSVNKKDKITIPFNFPSFVLNPLSIKAFNMLYYFKNYKREMEMTTPYEPFFYPLDALNHWNRMYGKRGFIQYQFVLPMHSGKKGLIKILNKIRSKNMGSFLAVLKVFGPQNDLISFPMEGLTLALDFPIKKGLFDFLAELDSIVLEYGGRIYLSKDARMSPETFKSGYPNYQDWKGLIERFNPQFKFSSSQSERLKITNS